MLKMEQEAAVQSFGKRRMVGDGVREKGCKEKYRIETGIYSWAVTGEQECDERREATQ